MSDAEVEKVYTEARAVAVLRIVDPLYVRFVSEIASFAKEQKALAACTLINDLNEFLNDLNDGSQVSTSKEF